jgi:Fur family ferric uptake transcriptional regulator
VSATTAETWTDHAASVLADAGYRSSAPRGEVIAAVAELGCSVTAREIADLLRERGSTVGLASVYRALDLLDRHGLVQRFDVGEGVARYEPAMPGGDHHHHLVCDSCGTVEPFEDDALEEAIHSLSGKTAFVIAAHDVTLHGECPACRADR